MSSILNAQELKGLQVQLAKEQALCESLRKEATEAHKKHQASQTKVRSLTNRIKELQSAAAEVEPVVSEHALLRYLERVKGIDFTALKAEILSPEAAEAIKFAKNGRIKGSEFELVFKNSVVVTVE